MGRTGAGIDREGFRLVAGCDAGGGPALLQPHIPRAWFMHAEQFQAAGRYREALGARQQCWRNTPRDGGMGYDAPGAFCTAGIHRALGDEARARGWLERALHSTRDATETFSAASSLLDEAKAREAMGDRGGAILAYQGALGRDLPDRDRLAVAEKPQPVLPKPPPWARRGPAEGRGLGRPVRPAPSRRLALGGTPGRRAALHEAGGD